MLELAELCRGDNELKMLVLNVSDASKLVPAHPAERHHLGREVLVHLVGGKRSGPYPPPPTLW